jgi:hypothetical protein
MPEEDSTSTTLAEKARRVEFELRPGRTYDEVHNVRAT